MKPYLLVSLMSAILLSSCGARTTLPQVAAATQTLPVASTTISQPNGAPTQAGHSQSPTPISNPARFGPDNFDQFVQVQTYRVAIETALDGSLSDMRVDALAYSPDGRLPPGRVEQI